MMTPKTDPFVTVKSSDELVSESFSSSNVFELYYQKLGLAGGDQSSLIQYIEEIKKILKSFELEA